MNEPPAPGGIPVRRRVPGDALWFFKAAPLFRDGGQALHARLEAASTTRHVGPRELIYRPGDLSDTVYLLKEGQVRLFRADARGNDATIAIVGPLDLFGEQTLAGGGTREEAAQATVPSLICHIPRDDFLAALADFPVISIRLTSLLARRIERLECRLANLVFKGAEARLCTVLLQLAADHGRPDESGAVDILLVLTTRDLGHLAGLGRPTTSTLLAGLRRAGLIEGRPRRLRLVRPDGLRRRADR